LGVAGEIEVNRSSLLSLPSLLLSPYPKKVK
jgi:hypothetical protein